MGDIRFSYNDDFNKTFLRPSQFVADRFLRCESMVFGVQKYGICVAKSRYLRCKSMFFRGCRVYIAICSQRCCRPSAALSQSVSSCRGPIYRARIYVNTHEMGRGNACAVMWKCIFGNGICVFVYVRIRAR